MSSLTLTLTGNSSHLKADYFPPIDLSQGEYVCGLIDFQTFNSIPNIDEINNKFHYGYGEGQHLATANDLYTLEKKSMTVRSYHHMYTQLIALIRMRMILIKTTLNSTQI